MNKPEYSCPVCNTEWYKSDLDSIGDLGCPGCRRKFDLEEFLEEDEPLWHDWREKCYFRMVRQKDIADETVAFLQTNDKLGL